MALKSFPRGGKKTERKSVNLSFSKQKKVKSKNQAAKTSSKCQSLTQNEALTSNTAKDLRYSGLHEGMILLGKIYSITDYEAIVSLPGQMSGRIQATDISEAYTELLKSVANNDDLIEDFKPLSELYKPGDYLICYVKQLNQSKRVTLSLEPELINQNLNPNSLEKLSKLSVTVSGVEDHGYVLDTGLKNFRAFLSVKDIKNQKSKLSIGKQILCSIQDLKQVENTFTAKVSVESKYMNVVETHITSLDNLSPGLKFSLRVKKVLSNGLQVYFSENYVGYINQIYLENPLKSFEVDQDLVGTLLYVLPTVKFPYFSLLPLEHENGPLTIGDIINKAKVISRDGRGILMRLKKGVRGFISLKRTGIDFKKIPAVFRPDSVHRCRVMAFDMMQKLYTCTMEKNLLDGKDLIKSSLRVGDIVKATVNSFDQKNGFVAVLIGKINALIPSDQISEPNETNKLKKGQNVVARVMEVDKRIILTLKKSLIESKLPILCKIDDAKVDSTHVGVITKITGDGILVQFYGNTKGWIPRRFLNFKLRLQNWDLVTGQVITTVIRGIDIAENKLTLALANSEKQTQMTNYKIGDVVEGVVTDSSVNGVHLRLNENAGQAFLPAGHMAPCIEVGKILAAKTVAGDVVSAIVFSTHPLLILSTIFAPDNNPQLKDVKPGDSLLCSIKNMRKESIKLLLPIVKCSKYGTVPLCNAENFESMYDNQILFGKVLTVDKKTQNIELTTQFIKIWQGITKADDKMTTAVDVLGSYLNKLQELKKNIYYTSKPISSINMGKRITGIVENITDHGLILKLEKDIKGIVRTNHFSKSYKIGDEVKGSVLWVDYPHEYVEVSLLGHFVNGIGVKQSTLGNIPLGSQLRGEIVLVTNWLVLVVLKGQAKGTLVALPSRRHLNDVLPDLSPYKIGAKIRCYGVLNKEEADILLPICMVKSAFEIHKSRIEQVQVQQSAKRKVDVSKAIKIKNEVTQDDEPTSKKRKIEKEIKSEPKQLEESKVKINFVLSDEMKVTEADQTDKTVIKSEALSECGFIWDSKPSLIPEVEDSSSDSDEEMAESTQTKKKKLTPAERRDLEQQKEREIREKEEALASGKIPQTVDQFDRLVLSSPDSSLVWLQYMAFHLQATEVEKARAVARRALKTINFREEDERLNVCQAWLNLESRFGTMESLQEVFQEAVRTNDAEKVYSHLLTVHSDAGRQAELEKTVNVMIAKFKQDPETWIKCGTALLKVGLKEKSRHIMQRGLQSLPANKHVDLMVRFAQLENKFGDKERSQTLFEQVLSSYPKRTDVWSCYVDSLVRSENIEIARKVLDRAISHALPAKKTKALYKKYISFEEKYGTPENVTRVKEQAVKYVEEQCKM